MEKVIKVIDGKNGEVAVRVRYPEGFAPVYTRRSNIGFLNIFTNDRSASFSAQRDSRARFAVSVPSSLSQKQIEEMIANESFSALLPHLCFGNRMSHADAYDLISYLTKMIFNGELYSFDSNAAVNESDPRLPQPKKERKCRVSQEDAEEGMWQEQEDLMRYGIED